MSSTSQEQGLRASNLVKGSNQKSTSSGSNSRQISILRDITQRTYALYRAELGSSTDQFLNSCPSVEDFFDFVAGIRLRQVPHHASRWDKVLKWAEFFAGQVFWFSEEAAHFAAFSHEAASFIWASCRYLLELGPKYIAVLERAFSIFYSCGLTLGFFIRHHELLHTSEDLQLIMASCFADLVKLVTGINIYYSQKQSTTTFSSRTFDELFGQNIEAFYAEGDQFTDAVWATRLEHLSKDGDVPVELIREFLTPPDSVTRLLAVSRNVRKTRADFTCEWFDRHLSDFLRGGKEILLVTGKSSSGKSVLSDWVVERLQAARGRRAADVLTYTVDADLKTELTTFSAAKGLLLQIIQMNVGDNNLYKSLTKAYELSINGKSLVEVENALWQSFEHGLRSDRNQVIVINGLDRLKGGEKDTLALLERLNKIASKNNKLKCMAFSRPVAKVPENYAQFSIQNENTKQDLHFVAESLLASTSVFDGLTLKDKTSLTSRLVEQADGSFDWIVQAIELLKQNTTSSTILKHVDTLPKGLQPLLEHTISAMNLKQRDTKALLAWLLASERPLLVSEVKRLMEIDTATCSLCPRTTRAEDDIISSCGSIIVIRDGFVRFRNPVTKQILLDRASSVTDFKNAGGFPFHIQEAHYDLTIRCVAYIKLVLTRSTQASTSPISSYELTELFESYDLLQYASRYWALHFQSSPMHEPTVQHKVTQGFKTCFPNTTLLALIEGTIYRQQYAMVDARNYHLLTLSLRKLVLGDASEPVLQSLLNLAAISEVLNSSEVNEYWYLAWKLSALLTITTVSEKCAHKYIETTSRITTTKSTEVTTRRTELLQYIIRIQREARTNSREILIYVETLVTLFTSIGETERAIQYQKEAHELTVEIYGRDSKEAIKSREAVISTTQKSTTRVEEVSEITRSHYEESIRTLEATDERRQRLTWSMIEYYERRKDFFHLEEILVSYWQSLTMHTHSKDTSVQQKRIDMAIRYAEFLRQQKREVEAENILRGTWIELEHTQKDTEDAAIIARKKKIGEGLQTIGAVAAAQAVWASLWAYYVRTGKQTSQEATSISTALTQTSKDINTTDTTHEVTTMRQIWETTISSTTTQTIDVKTVKTAVTLVERYYREQRWTEVIQITTTTLTKLWSGFTSKDIRTSLPQTHLNEIVELLNRLAYSHWKLRKLALAEMAYRRIFYAALSTQNVPENILLGALENLVGFYQTHSMIDKIAVVYRDAYPEIEKRRGKTDSLTTSTLYSLGDISVQNNDTKNLEFAYRTIHQNFGADICHREAVRAALALCTLYERERNYPAAHKIYASLWQMFIKHGKDYELKPDFAEELYSKYILVLKASNTDYLLIRQIAVDYRKACIRFYGATHEATLKATIQLAEINEEREEHLEESIALYEEAEQKCRDLPKGQVSNVTLTTIHAHRDRLPHMYSTSKLSTSPKAIPIYEAEHQKHQSRYGHSHRDSLTWLSFLVLATAANQHADSSTKAREKLQIVSTSVLTSEKSAQTLSDSGARIAEIYVKAGLKSEAEKFSQQLRRQMIFGSSDMSKQIGAQPLDRRSWVFLVSFDTQLKGDMKAYSSIMASLINEVFLYDGYKRVVAQKGDVVTTLSYGSRVLQFMTSIHDETGYTVFYQDLLVSFANALKVNGSPTPALRQFFDLVIAEVWKQDVHVNVYAAGVRKVAGLIEQKKFTDAQEFGQYVDRFQLLVGGYKTHEVIGHALKLSLILGGRSGATQCPDQKIHDTMMQLSGSVLKQIIAATRASKISLTDFPITELNEICGLLGGQQNLEDLEYILNLLWLARHTQPSWSAATIVHLGRKLVETQFALGKHSLAIHLCEDICYNLRRVWGALDSTTVEMHELLSSFYTSTSPPDYRKAMLVHEDILRDTVSDKGEELEGAEAASIATRHLRLLRGAYGRNGGWDKEKQAYVDLYQQLAHVFGSEESWKSAKIDGAEKWSVKNKEVSDGWGVWKRPEHWEFIGEAAKRKHENYLRKSSGTWRLSSTGHLVPNAGMRLSRSMSSASSMNGSS